MRKALLALVLSPLCAGLPGCRVGPPPSSTARVSTLTDRLGWEELTLGPGDVVRVGVYGHPDLSTTSVAPFGSRVDGEGNLSLPMVGAVLVGGRSVGEARAAVTAAFARFVNDPRVDLSVVEHAARRFYLYGEVNKPGAYVLDRPMDVYQALALGGGFTSRANRKKVVLLRGRPENLEVAVLDGETAEPRNMIAVRPDDLVFVRRTGAGKFSDEALPILTGISSAFGSVATLILIDDTVN